MFRVCSTTPCAPTTLSSPPACFTLPEHITRMPTPVLSRYFNSEKSRMIFLSCSFSRSSPCHSTSCCSRPRVILPVSPKTMTSAPTRLFRMLSDILFSLLLRCPDRRALGSSRKAPTLAGATGSGLSFGTKLCGSQQTLLDSLRQELGPRGPKDTHLNRSAIQQWGSVRFFRAIPLRADSVLIQVISQDHPCRRGEGAQPPKIVSQSPCYHGSPR